MDASEKRDTSTGVCEDCGATTAGGRAGCLRLFEEVIALEFSDYRYGRIHRLTVDAYSLQHPDKYMLSGKSFAAHLTGMCAALEYDDAPVLNRAVQRWLGTNPRVEKPARLPEFKGGLTITYIRGASDAEEHTRRVREWAQEVWAAWSEHHALARRLIAEACK